MIEIVKSKNKIWVFQSNYVMIFIKMNIEKKKKIDGVKMLKHIAQISVIVISYMEIIILINIHG